MLSNNTFVLTIHSGCDGNDGSNPLNWKHGGFNQVDTVRYNIIPTQDQGYTPGSCSFHLQEDEQWSGVDGPGTERSWSYQIEQALMKDGAGNEIGRLGFKKDSGDGDPQSEGDGNSLQWETKLPDKLIITSEAQGDPKDYIQFTIGAQSWKTSDPATGTPRCKVGGWSSSYSPAVSVQSFETCLRCQTDNWGRIEIWIASSTAEKESSGYAVRRRLAKGLYDYVGEYPQVRVG